MPLLQLKQTKCTLIINGISRNLFYIFQAMKVHRQKVSCRIQALQYNVAT